MNSINCVKRFYIALGLIASLGSTSVQAGALSFLGQYGSTYWQDQICDEQKAQEPTKPAANSKTVGLATSEVTQEQAEKACKALKVEDAKLDSLISTIAKRILREGLSFTPTQRSNIEYLFNKKTNKNLYVLIQNIVERSIMNNINRPQITVWKVALELVKNDADLLAQLKKVDSRIWAMLTGARDKVLAAGKIAKNIAAAAGKSVKDKALVPGRFIYSHKIGAGIIALTTTGVWYYYNPESFAAWVINPVANAASGAFEWVKSYVTTQPDQSYTGRFAAWAQGAIDSAAIGFGKGTFWGN